MTIADPGQTGTQATTIDVRAIAAISRYESTRLATTEYARFTELVRQLQSDDFSKPTECAGGTFGR